MDKIKMIFYYLILLIFLFFIFLCLISEKYEFAIAILGICIPFITIFFNQDFEIKKIKMNKIYDNNLELYTELSQIINKILTDLSCLEHNHNSYIFYVNSRKFKDKQNKKDEMYYDVPSETETNNELHMSTKKWMEEFHKNINLLYELYDTKGVSFSLSVDKQYRKVVDNKWITQITKRWHNSNLSNNKQEALSCFFADYNFKDVLLLKKEVEKFSKIVKIDLGVS